MIDTVKLSKLRLSPINVRRVSDDQLRLDELTPDIEARGVLQNMLVTPAKPKGTFEVLDGGRRWRSLMRLVEKGVIVADEYDVPIRVITGNVAHLSETSFAATYHQLPLTPAEECRAFEHFIGKGADIDGVATRFGKTRRFVEGRLRLASLATPIFDALAAGEITLDLAKAYASTESHDKQLAVWEQYGNQRYISGDQIRRVIANDALKSNEPVAILVGVDRYVAAGGRIERDLFSEFGDRWVDPEIARNLAGALMEAEAKRVGEETGLAWVRPIASAYSHNHTQGLYRVILQRPDLTGEQEIRMDAINARREELEELMADEGLTEEDFNALNAEDDALFAEFEEIENRQPILPEELKAHIGIFLLLNSAGEMALDTQYFSEQPISRVERPTDDLGADEEGDEGEDSDEGERMVGGFRIGGADPKAPSKPDEALAPGGKPLSARLFDELAMQRRDILAASILGDPALALDYLIFVMADSRFGNVGYASSRAYGSTIRASAPQDPILGDQPVTTARGYLAEAKEGLDAGWSEDKDEVVRFEAFRTLNDDSKAAWLAYVVARSFEAKAGCGITEHIPLHNRLATILEVDVASWWRPTAENFFDRVSKGSILTLLSEVGGAALMARHATLKKGEISTSCQKLFAGESIVEQEVKEAALAWVPAAMQFQDRPQEPVGEGVDDIDETSEVEVASESGESADLEEASLAA